MEYYAHISEDGLRRQTVAEHLTETAALCRTFAGAFGAEADGEFMGLAHDLGKCADSFQKRLLEGGPIVDHATAGAVACAKLGRSGAAACVAGHHGGLSDFGNLKNDRAGDATLCGRLKKGIAELLYSCLVDADFLDTERFMNGERGSGGYDDLPTLLQRLEDYIAPW